ncbi:hypothetical protein F511_44414 [Dorcoceras hygrometricum]|uniref:Uncharacterized protein n=1 Tax=Dorcoceras hygrometricum TaxID=472368 RepID=A0A2Z7AYA8_9LAMI|nr:hypothetical protein F511_44414 [Dorcoceras hygrometricum]
MSRFFFVKRVKKKRDPWKCGMSWRDNMYTLTPRTLDLSPNLDSFLDVMRDKSYNAPELIQEDILCFFGFSCRGVELVGDLGTAALAWGGEVIKRLTRAQREAGNLRRDEGCRDAQGCLGNPGAEAGAERAALLSEKNALEGERAAMKAELDGAKARAAEEAERIRGEVANAWALGKEEFLQSSELERLSTRLLREEHPAPFLDAKKALRDMPEDDKEVAEEEEEEEEGEEEADATYPSSPKP